MSNWKKYFNDKKIKESKYDFSIIVPKDFDKPNPPLFCPVCNFLIKTIQDEEYYKKWECCFNCATDYAEPNRDKWNNGWRPKI